MLHLYFFIRYLLFWNCFLLLEAQNVDVLRMSTKSYFLVLACINSSIAFVVAPIAAFGIEDSRGMQTAISAERL